MVAALEISLRIGQRVRHQDYQGKRVTGIVRGLSVDSEDVLHADIALDEPIVIPALNEDDHDLPIYRQHVPAHELAPFDEREELIARLLDAAQKFLAPEVLLPQLSGPAAAQMIEAANAARAAIEKATGQQGGAA